MNGIDKNKTKANVKRVLKEFRRLHRLADDPNYPTISNEDLIEYNPEESLEEIIQLARQKKLDIIQAVNRLSENDYRLILFEKYMARYKKDDVELMGEWNYSYTAFYTMFDKALIEFAESYKGGRLLAYMDGENAQTWLESL